MRNELLVYTLGREQCVNDNVFEWLYLRWGAFVRLFADRDAFIVFALSVTRVSRSKSGFRYLSIDLDSEIGTKGNIEFDHDERNRLIYFREEISRGRVFFFNREKAEYDFFILL